ncbi:unnamed protein product [Sphagnum jensenii]|uniref:Uncharacterized protein n=1 Tax=Sphagnum jensenii TaxID=128206 RepID=A0ABP0XBA2_9BRYO
MVFLLGRGGENSGVQTRRMLQSWSVYSDGAEKMWSTDAAHAPVMVCLLRRGGENSGVQTRRMLKKDGRRRRRRRRVGEQKRPKLLFMKTFDLYCVEQRQLMYGVML